MNKDNIFEYILILFILSLFVSLGYAVLSTAYQEGEKNIKEYQEVKSLPEKCAEFYDDGTDNWKECMGVGYVRTPHGEAVTRTPEADETED